jgi:hypothetical protein
VVQDGIDYVPPPPFPPPVLPPPTLVRILQPQPDAWARRLGIPAGVEKPEAWALRLGIPSSHQASDLTQMYRPSPILQIIAVDNLGNPGFSPADWILGQSGADGAGFYSSRSSGVPPPSGTVAWNFNVSCSGYYKVVANWTPASQNASDATYILTADFGTPLSTAYPVPPISQQIAPPSSLLPPIYLNRTIKIELNVSGTGQVIADAIQIIPLNKLQIQLPVSGSSEGFKVSVTVSPQ